MRCRDIMTRDPLCCVASDSVSKVAQLMYTQNIGAIPVVENPHNRKLIGMVTDRDLALRVVGENQNPQNTQVEQVMTPNPVACHPNDELNKTLDAMAKYQIRRIPVVDNEGQVLGIIAQADVALRTDNELTTAQLVEEISKPD